MQAHAAEVAGGCCCVRQVREAAQHNTLRVCSRGAVSATAHTCQSTTHTLLCDKHQSMQSHEAGQQ